MRCSVVTRKNDASAIDSHATMNTYASSAIEHERHRGEEHVVLEADEAGRRAFARAEVAGGEERDRGGGRPQQQQEERRQRIEAQVERQVRQPERQHVVDCGPRRSRRTPSRPGASADSGAGGKEHATGQGEICGDARGRARRSRAMPRWRRGPDRASARSSRFRHSREPARALQSGAGSSVARNEVTGSPSARGRRHSFT